LFDKICSQKYFDSENNNAADTIVVVVVVVVVVRINLLIHYNAFKIWVPAFVVCYLHGNRLRWSRGNVLAFSTQVCGFKPGRSRRIFRAKMSSACLPSEGK